MTDVKYTFTGDKIIAEAGHEFDGKKITIGGHTLIGYNDWFSRDILPLWQKYQLVDCLTGKVQRYLEIGVNCGVSFAWVMQHFLASDGFATGIDPYSHFRNRNDTGLKIARDLCQKNLQPWHGKFRIIEEPSQLALSRMQYSLFDALHCDRSPDIPLFDFVYIDGSHSAPDALRDITIAFELMRPGGIIVIDDYNRQFSHGVKQVRPAVNAFFDCYSHIIDPLFICQRQAAFIKDVGRRRRGA